MSDTFNVGDCVELKSGGPKMTVEYISEMTENVGCVWFVKQDVKRDAFTPAALKPYEAPSARKLVGNY